MACTDINCENRILRDLPLPRLANSEIAACPSPG
jgi:hypothetical protein